MTEVLCALQAQQKELTLRHEKEKERELSRKFQLQKEQYESTIQRQLTFIDQVGSAGLWPTPPQSLVLLSSKTCVATLQLINDKKALSERCEGVVGELKLVDQKYTKKMTQMQEQHEMVSSAGCSCERVHCSRRLLLPCSFLLFIGALLLFDLFLFVLSPFFLPVLPCLFFSPDFQVWQILGPLCEVTFLA